MRLIDNVVQAPPENPASGYSQMVRDCHLRYVLDRKASLQCADVFLSGNEYPRIGDAVLRLPAPRFWLELFSSETEEAEGDLATGTRVGMLLDATEDCRSGTIVAFAETIGGAPHLVAGAIEFDLEDDQYAANRPEGLRLQHESSDAINKLLACTRFVLRDEWIGCARAKRSPFAELIRREAEVAWAVLPAMLSFSALLNSREVVRSQASDLSRLNKARAKRGKPELLEHIEVTLNLLSGRSGAARGVDRAASGDRSSPRFHFVRGHPVHRSGKTFWRSSHYRGDLAGALTTTVAVTARPRVSV